MSARECFHKSGEVVPLHSWQPLSSTFEHRTEPGPGHIVFEITQTTSVNRHFTLEPVVGPDVPEFTSILYPLKLRQDNGTLEFTGQRHLTKLQFYTVRNGILRVLWRVDPEERALPYTRRGEVERLGTTACSLGQDKQEAASEWLANMLAGLAR